MNSLFYRTFPWPKIINMHYIRFVNDFLISWFGVSPKLRTVLDVIYDTLDCLVRTNYTSSCYSFVKLNTVIFLSVLFAFVCLFFVCLVGFFCLFLFWLFMRNIIKFRRFFTCTNHLLSGIYKDLNKIRGIDII